jgi:heme/copper-type cytochrome/quinol oxidase subunit 3
MIHSITHFFHIVKPSPWPFLTSVTVLSLCINLVAFLDRHTFSGLFLFFNLFILIRFMKHWWIDIIRESKYENYLSRILIGKGLRFGFILFIISEVMFFVAFFWAFFHVSITPGIEIGSDWPLTQISPFNPFEMPLINTLVLLTSGIAITWVHRIIRDNPESFFFEYINYYLKQQIYPFKKSQFNFLLVDNFMLLNIGKIIFKKNLNSFFLFLISKLYTENLKFINKIYNNNIYGLNTTLGFLFTLFLAILFTFLQGYEYIVAPFTIADGVYGSTFFLCTGFHGLHVIIGTLFITVQFFRYLNGEFLGYRKSLIGLEAAIWYWHFVDVVWLFLYATIYFWGCL